MEELPLGHPARIKVHQTDLELEVEDLEDSDSPPRTLGTDM
jgi:hypothetical protein